MSVSQSFSGKPAVINSNQTTDYKTPGRRARIETPGLVQTSQNIRQDSRTQYRACESEYDKGEENEKGRYEPHSFLVRLLQTVQP